MYRDINININIVNVVLALYKTEEDVQECIIIKFLYIMNKGMKKKESKGNDKMSSAWKWDKEREEGLYHQCSINRIKKRAIEQI
jgi:hypothetical protein